MAEPPTWQELHDPDDIARERAIRADQRRLDLRELQATVKDLLFMLDQFDKDPVNTIPKIRRLAQRLVTLSERRAAA